MSETNWIGNSGLSRHCNTPQKFAQSDDDETNEGHFINKDENYDPLLRDTMLGLGKLSMDDVAATANRENASNTLKKAMAKLESLSLSSNIESEGNMLTRQEYEQVVLQDGAEKAKRALIRKHCAEAAEGRQNVKKIMLDLS